MFTRQDRILVAVSGGKDSLALWDVLIKLGYDTAGLHIHQGIFEYSASSFEKTTRFAKERDLTLITIDLAAEGDLDIPGVASSTRRTQCSACGVIKRHYFNKAAVEGGFTIMATGHNLDDEAARLLGNCCTGKPHIWRCRVRSSKPPTRVWSKRSNRSIV
jgi:tRNA(Ile)-lysidine synthase TilS/MesJ